MFSIVFSEVALRAAKVKRGTVRLVFGTRSNFFPHSTFLILKLFIRCLLVGVREGLGISLSYKWKQIGIFSGGNLGGAGGGAAAEN
jgi:hypothetical protein